MATTIKTKSSNVASKVPEASALETAELAVNLKDQKLYSKDADGNVFEIGKSEAIALDDLTDVDTTGVGNGDVIAYDQGSSEWKPVSPASLSVDVDLDYTAAPDKGTVTNTAGDNAEIPLATAANAGLFSGDEKEKLAGIEDGAQVNVPGEVPSGGTDDRPGTPNTGDLYFDTDLGALLYWDGSAWEEVGTNAGDPLWTEVAGALVPATTTNNVLVGGADAVNAKIKLNTNGSATFAGTITADGYSFASLQEL